MTSDTDEARSSASEDDRIVRRRSDSAASHGAPWTAVSPISSSDDADESVREMGSDAPASVEDVRQAVMFEFLRTGFWIGLGFATGLTSYLPFFFKDVLFVDRHEVPCLDLLDMNDFSNHTDEHRIKNYNSVYRDFGLLSLWPVCWALLTFAWSHYSINYQSVFGIDPLRFRELHGSNAACGACKIIIIWGVCRTVFDQTVECDMGFRLLYRYANYMPGLMMLFLTLYTLCWSGCLLPKLLLSAVLSPFSRAGVTERDSYIANWLTSLVKPIEGATYGACLYASGQFLRGGPSPDDFCYDEFFSTESVYRPSYVVILAPNILRVAQCLRQMRSSKKRHPALTNACKYLVSCLVTLFGLVHGPNISSERHPFFFALWFSLIIFKSLYAFIWDITEDWGMLTSARKCLCFPCGRFRLRRERLLSEDARPYILAMIANFVARFFSTMTFLPDDSLVFQEQILGSFVFVSPSVEILRRTMWSLIKIEYKQVSKNKELAKKGDPLMDSKVHVLKRKETVMVLKANKSSMKRELACFAVIGVGLSVLIITLQID